MTIDWVSLFPTVGIPLLLTVLLACVQVLPYSRAGRTPEDEAELGRTREEIWFLAPDFCFLAATGSIAVIIQKASAVQSSVLKAVILAVAVCFLSLVGGALTVYFWHRKQRKKSLPWGITVVTVAVYIVLQQLAG